MKNQDSYERFFISGIVGPGIGKPPPGVQSRGMTVSSKVLEQLKLDEKENPICFRKRVILLLENLSK